MCLLGAVCQWELRVDLRDGPKSLSGALMLDIHCAVLVLVSDENIFLN